MIEKPTPTRPGVGARRAPTVAGDERGEHARDAAGRAAHGAVGAVLLDQVEGLRLKLLRQRRRVQQGGEGVAALGERLNLMLRLSLNVWKCCALCLVNLG